MTEWNGNRNGSRRADWGVSRPLPSRYMVVFVAGGIVSADGEICFFADRLAGCNGM